MEDVLEASSTDARINAWLTDYFERQLKKYDLAGTKRGWAWNKAEKRGMVTRAKLAEAIGMAESSLSRRLSGEYRWQTDDVDRIAAYLKVSTTTIQKGPRKK